MIRYPDPVRMRKNRFNAEAVAHCEEGAETWIHLNNLPHVRVSRIRMRMRMRTACT